MEITKKLGEKIIKQARRLINEHMIIVNKKAIVIASTLPNRVGNFHEGADKAIKSGTKTIISIEDEKEMQGVKAGINLPIIIQGNVIGTIGITGNPDKVVPFGSLMQKMTELLIKESIFIQETEWKERILERFVFDWLQLENNYDEAFLKRAHVLGFNTEATKRCIVVLIKANKEQQLAAIISSCKAWLETELAETVLKWETNKLLLILEDKHQKNSANLSKYMQAFQRYVESEFQIEVQIGIGNETNFRSLNTSYSQAMKALKACLQPITFYDDLLLDILLTEIQPTTKSGFIHHVLQPIIRDTVLMNTLATYIKNDLQLKETANELHIHINTLHYRLNKIYKRTNLNPREVHALTAFHLAFLLLEEIPK
ncbi:CdaR family transcriptional regulator [Virgibacillus sp. W0430]|uniref:CdaR family transcriptional regulator n=1 Tax=Virgibacillus sp. W0430 TaxID=3391580 RepID=UPI003F46C570